MYIKRLCDWEVELRVDASTGVTESINNTNIV